jgi:hypothetical protein
MATEEEGTRAHLAPFPRAEASVLPLLVALVFLVNLGGVGHPPIPLEPPAFMRAGGRPVLPPVMPFLDGSCFDRRRRRVPLPVFRSLRLIPRMPALARFHGTVPAAGAERPDHWAILPPRVAGDGDRRRLQRARLFVEPQRPAHFVVTHPAASHRRQRLLRRGAPRSRLWPGSLAAAGEMAPRGTRIRLAHRLCSSGSPLASPLSVTALIALARTEVVALATPSSR